MARNKSSETPHYELLYIVSNKFAEDEVKPIIEKVNKQIVDFGGEITHEEEWGKKKLAYQIKGFNHGYYCLVEFDLPGDKMAKINNNLRLSNEILRHIIIAKDKRTAEQIEKDKKVAETFFKKIAGKEETEVKEKKEDEVKVEEEKKKTDLKDLDEKLDKILETDDLI